MNQTIVLGLSAIVLVLAGCTAPAVQPQQAAEGPPGGGEEASAAGGGGASPALAPLAPLVLHFSPDLALRETAPSEEGTVPLGMPVNGPHASVEEYPIWTGTLPQAVEVTEAGIRVAFSVTTNSASMAADSTHVFAIMNGGEHLPGFFMNLNVGDLHLEGRADGPDVLLMGDIAHIEGTLIGDTGLVAAGEEVRYYGVVTYTHVQGATEFQYILGPEYEGTVTFA